jgi:hypothetical protein
LTFAFFVILIILAFGADKYNAYKIEKAKSEDERREEELRNQKAGLKTRLREIAKLYDEVTIIKIAHGSIGDSIEKNVISEVNTLLKDLFEVDVTSNLTAHEIKESLQPDSLFERFAARKAAGTVSQKDFLSVKG